MGRFLVLALAAGFACAGWGMEHAVAADARSLAKLQAPPPAELQVLPEGPKQAVRFARAVIRLNPEPWARVRESAGVVGDEYVPPPIRVLTWEDGQVDIEASLVSQIVSQEFRSAGVPLDGATESLFASEATADLQLGLTITDMKGSFCQGCSRLLGIGERWSGVVTQHARWELYSGRERRVVATVETEGGFTAPKGGLSGSPTQLVYEAIRDNVRRLIASEEFRRIVLSDPATGHHSTAAALPPIAFVRAAEGRQPVGSAANSVAAIFAGEAHGSGFLISRDGYLLTNRHVVGGAKFVKVRFNDGAEALGEVVRSDARRDVALIRTGAARQALVLRNSPVSVGEAVFAVGTPLDAKFQGTVTRGIVSASRIYEGLSFIQSDVATNGGNSGGPLLDDAGAVIGICVSGMQINGAPVGINLFIPIDDALKALGLTPVS